MKKELDTVKRYMKTQDFKLTQPRRKIIEAVFATHEHFTADELRTMLREKGENVSTATIYRTLSLLCDGGFVESLDLGRGQLYYEHILGHKNHFHLVCSDSGRIIEFQSAEIEQIVSRVARARGFHVDSISLYARGRGRACE
jgi:Fur family ferric uptake transcriptional regulator